MIIVSEDYNPVTGLTTRVLFRQGKVVIQTLQDADPYIRQNREEYNNINQKGRKHFGKEGLGTKMASIPMGFAEEIKQKRGLNILACSDEQLRRLLNDREFSKFRTCPGRL
jgi:hypothetical protein